ncbi:MAG: V-type ATP synthase subunit I, partial [Clostridia bacterium]|nr:V-type ATP synthase subunit I [Clostridia bacterium]
TAVLTGWVPEHMAEKTAALLEKRGAAWQFSDPEPEDDVPVLLINNAMASPFEPVVSLYSLPAYGTFDPTFLMSFFYILIFGLMFADVGYGLLLTAGCILGRYLLHTEGTLRKFCNMFFLCGISMTGMGILFGGYFGDLPQILAQNFGGRQTGDTALWFSPLQDPMGFLVISIAVGAVHLFTGLAVRFWILWRAGDRLSAVSDAGSWMLIFTGAGLCLLHPYAGLTIAGIGAAVLVCTGGRHEKNPVMKVLKGLSGLYGIVNYVSDLLSYSRILSLGLASAVIASVFNIIGTMAGPTFIGVMLLVVVGMIGHGMNLAINLLGSFVHTSRLQYIEFFGKFYVDGGRAFTPLEPQSRYVRFR